MLTLPPNKVSFKSQAAKAEIKKKTHKVHKWHLHNYPFSILISCTMKNAFTSTLIVQLPQHSTAQCMLRNTSHNIVLAILTFVFTISTIMNSNCLFLNLFASTLSLAHSFTIPFFTLHTFQISMSISLLTYYYKKKAPTRVLPSMLPSLNQFYYEDSETNNEQ